MTPAETAAILRRYNAWRRPRPDDLPMPDPIEIGEAIDAAVEMIERLEAAEKSDAESLAMYRKARDERDALRAKITEMERQEPVAWLHETRRDSDVVTDAVKHVWGKAAVGSMAAYSIPLYLAPGAQPAPSVPEVQSQSHEVLGQTCIDGGKCHHHCNQRLDKRCFRRECCEPFSDYCGPWVYDDGPPKPKLEAKP